MASKTLYDKLWDAHVVRTNEDGTALLYIDRHLVHEVTSPQAFEGLRLAGRRPWRISANLAVPDHNVPTTDRAKGIADPISRLQVQTLDDNCRDFGITEFLMDDPRQGIVHVIGPEQGATLPGMTVVCGDSHTSTHGAFGALAFGIGTSEVEHVLATQCLLQKKSRNMLVSINGKVGPGVTAKDIALAVIGEIGTAGGTGYAVEFGGQAIRDLSVEGRMTVCNMAIEAGARAGMVAVDEKTVEYVRGRAYAPKGEDWQRAVAAWSNLHTDPDAAFDREVHLDAACIAPQVTWGTSPEMVVPVTERVPATGLSKCSGSTAGCQVPSLASTSTCGIGTVSCGSTSPRPAMLDCPARRKMWKALASAGTAKSGSVAALIMGAIPASRPSTRCRHVEQTVVAMEGGRGIGAEVGFIGGVLKPMRNGPGGKSNPGRSS